MPLWKHVVNDTILCHWLEFLAYSIGCLNFDLLIWLKVNEMLWGLTFFCGMWSQKSEQEAISVTISGKQVQLVRADPVIDGFQMWNALVRMTLLLFLINGMHIFNEVK
jgi:hypothetical protein